MGAAVKVGCLALLDGPGQGQETWVAGYDLAAAAVLQLASCAPRWHKQRRGAGRHKGRKEGWVSPWRTSSPVEKAMHDRSGGCKCGTKWSRSFRNASGPL